MERKKIMIIGAGDFQEPLIEYSLEKYDVIIVAPVISDSFKERAYFYYETDVRDNETILSVAKEHNIDGVITDQTDIPVRTVAYVAEKMGLPGIGYETSLLFTDKVRMNERLKELGVGAIPSASAKTLDEAVRFMDELGCDVLIKPSDSQGSRGIYICSGKKDLEQYFGLAKSFSYDGTVLIQKYLQGIEFFAESLTFNGETKNLIIGDTIYFESQKSFSAKYRITPSVRDKELVQRVLDVNQQIIEGFGLNQGITHSEFIVSDDAIYLLETAARGGGVYISSDLISLPTGLCTEEFLTDICLGTQQKMPEFEKNLCACGYMAFYLPPGKVISVDGIDAVKELPYVHRNQLYKITDGMINDTKPSDKTSRYAIIVSASDNKELHERIEIIKKMLDIRIETPDGIRGPIWE